MNVFKPQGAPAHTYKQDTPSLLGDWKQYAMGGVQGGAATTSSARRDQEGGGVLKSAFTNVTNRLPGNAHHTTSGGLPSKNQIMCFTIMLGLGSFCIFISVIMFLPLIVIMPGKFASTFSLGSCLVVGSMFALKGPRNQMNHMLTKERLPFTVGFIGSMVGAIYFSVVAHSYILCLVFSGIEIVSLLYYVLSYFPGGTAGLKFVLTMVKNSIVGCFTRR